MPRLLRYVLLGVVILLPVSAYAITVCTSSCPPPPTGTGGNPPPPPPVIPPPTGTGDGHR